MSAPNWK